jgi:cyanate permease
MAGYCGTLSWRTPESRDLCQLYRADAWDGDFGDSDSARDALSWCALFGLGVGNTTSLPGLLVQQEFRKQHFARIVSGVVAINQFSFAFGPSLLGQPEDAEGSYGTGLLACLSMEALAAFIVISPAIVRCRKAGRVTG